MKSGIKSIGPGRYSATSAVMCSTELIWNFLHRSRMPLDSNWNTPSVFRPVQQIVRFRVVQRQMVHVQRDAGVRFTISPVFRMTVSVFKPEEVHLQQAEVAHRAPWRIGSRRPRPRLA